MLVRALLGAGVPAVVGTLWPIDDTTTPPLAKAFHRFLLDGDSAATAMQKAQLEFLYGETQLFRSARFWGGFEVIGSARLVTKRRKNP
jgi:CHAT domain-containing protein